MSTSFTGLEFKSCCPQETAPSHTALPLGLARTSRKGVVLAQKHLQGSVTGSRMGTCREHICSLSRSS
jgi:hypothetical protein